MIIIDTSEKQQCYTITPSYNVYLSSCSKLTGPVIPIVVPDPDSRYVNDE
jgi:hypothetical protein